ncbi:Alkylated DNA nucleotide flippase Atl1, participates in nucleotide excision repair, Ada-like DNA-binding domain [Micromonospora coriariae]|uniref:Alkylated DNA nucleotide flippase Atl1, participates in nucleotide excision repair, Ada-like DNA-binding domain n=1 Tax=Micromonospora coriariae TaxID=285665 RepID=A0A1C4V2A8_9ACTN|nr:MGMT family protein [Micromonospora coriariae]SCE78188.1 Alkylated DNA nucleotide flippase Atl1, participates in nucleotide excision repair, Ada-like DNA-binding domain [Micromonospora coriariae]
MASLPKISPLKWTSIRDVLPHEALDFTPWLASNLDLLANVLGLEELELVGTESSVDAFRLDIRATGTDGSGEAIGVVIENQYDKTDHDHLGKLVTYAARADTEAERVLAVWIVEHPVPAHLAAIEFLNRISAAHVGWVLISPRFVPSPDGYFVHFEKHAEPNAFLQSAKESAALASPERAAFMAELFALVDQPLRKQGFHHVWSHPAGHMIRAYLPKTWPAASWAEIRVLAARNRLRVVLFIRAGQLPVDYNIKVLEGIRQRHAAAIQQAVGSNPPIEWHARSDSDRCDYSRITSEGHGYLSGKPEEAAELVTRFAMAVLDALGQDDETDFPDPDQIESATGRADTATISAIAACIKPGEWATYGDLSKVATGTSSAAIAVGTIAARTPAFPNPHRILAGKGKIPNSWASSDGGGPDACRERLGAEGISFLPDGRAAPQQRASVDALRTRWREQATASDLG